MIEVIRNSIYGPSLRPCPDAYHGTLPSNSWAISILEAIYSDIDRNVKNIHARNILI